jgi:hypothetical protein
LPDVPEGRGRTIRCVRRNPHGDFAWTRGTPGTFRSSSLAERDFCKDCGTPLSYRKLNGSVIELLTGAFDRPDRVIPTYQTGIESKLAWAMNLHNPGQNDNRIMGFCRGWQHCQPSASGP